MNPEAAQATSPTRERNRTRIVDAARQLWSHNPNASMDDVAREAGVVRRTLYGHFAQRNDLIMAVASKAGDVLVEIAGRSTWPDACTASAELARLTSQVWSFAHDWRLLAVLAQQVDHTAVDRALSPINAAFLDVVSAGQRSGEFSDHLPPEIMVHILQAQAMRLQAASDDAIWTGNAEDAAVTALITAGVDRVAAADIIADKEFSSLESIDHQ